MSEPLPQVVSDTTPPQAIARASRRPKPDRDQWCMIEALRSCRLPRRARVLDIPCGPIERLERLVAEGFRVTAGDDSIFQLAQIRAEWHERTADEPEQRHAVQFDQTDVFETGYPGNSFNVVICDGVLSRFSEAFSRVAVLAELGRVTNQWVVVSFANSATLQGLCMRLPFCRKKSLADPQMPISLNRLRRDARKAGLNFSAMIGTQGPIAARCYAIFQKQRQARI